jgi:hypothetical protein
MFKITEQSIKPMDSELFKKMPIKGKKVHGVEAKKMIGEMARNGKSEWALDKELKEAGVSGDYCEKRKNIIGEIVVNAQKRQQAKRKNK